MWRKKTKKIFVAVHGNVVVGPTMEDVPDREIPPSTRSITNRLVTYAQRIFPGLKDFQPIGTMVGLRPATQQKDYFLEALPNRYWSWMLERDKSNTGPRPCVINFENKCCVSESQNWVLKKVCPPGAQVP